MRLLIMGAPGAGKGTQATALASQYHVPAISTGDIFRANIKQQTPLGVQLKQLIDAGEYVPDEITEQIVADRLAQVDAANGFLLDGFPRTMHQVHFLDTQLANQNEAIDVVVSLVVEPDQLITRLLRRAEIEGRADDNAEAIRRRMAVYTEQTAPLLSYYRDKGLLVEVDGNGTLEEVRETMLTAVDAYLEHRVQPTK